jgi:hypothetical protein
VPTAVKACWASSKEKIMPIPLRMASLLTAFATSLSFAQGADLTATYIVPTPEHLLEYSRFNLQIVNPYSGSSSTEISYLFPKDLTGDPALLVDFKRTSINLESGVSQWEAHEMTATCTDDGAHVQCNIYLKKNDLRRSSPLFNATKAKDFINNSGLPKHVIDAKLDVLEQFLSSEPAGLLTYEY